MKHMEQKCSHIFSEKQDLDTTLKNVDSAVKELLEK